MDAWVVWDESGLQVRNSCQWALLFRFVEKLFVLFRGGKDPSYWVCWVWSLGHYISDLFEYDLVPRRHSENGLENIEKLGAHG